MGGFLPDWAAGPEGRAQAPAVVSSRRASRTAGQRPCGGQEHHPRQAAQRLKAGEAWQDHNLVFRTSVGTRLDASNARRAFRKITKAAEIGPAWSPRELRHSFVSIMSEQGVPIESIAALVGHAGTSVTEAVYRHQISPVITKGPPAINSIFGEKPTG
ncbi:tyrosine-type recombinase/integrase [Nonomuraea sp. NPDC050227]|uniref:tyrosine-type recombinase/integrase n=1 Tax=Nonomuraea sp. NPDC050227 TaxID=3364360 RepID=UPI00379D1083